MTTASATLSDTATDPSAVETAPSAEAQRFHDESSSSSATPSRPWRSRVKAPISATCASVSPARAWTCPSSEKGGVNAVFLSAGLETIHIEHWDNALWATDPPKRQVLRPVFKGPSVVKRVSAQHRCAAPHDRRQQ